MLRHLMRPRIGLAVTLAVVAFGAAACHGNGGAVKANQSAENAQLGIYNQTQPVPQFNKSQLRQTLIEIEMAQSKPTPTTTFFFNLGSSDPFSQCPSIGFPVATTDQVTNPQQLARTGGNYNVDGVIPQIDPNGIYSGDSTGTYVLCLNDSGTPYAAYWEGYVYTVSGSAKWDAGTHSISNVTNPTGGFTRLNDGDVRPSKATTTTVKP